MTARALIKAGLVSFETGTSPLMTLTFDGGAQGQALDLRPTLPLMLKH